MVDVYLLAPKLDRDAPAVGAAHERRAPYAIARFGVVEACERGVDSSTFQELAFPGSPERFRIIEAVAHRHSTTISLEGSTRSARSQHYL